MSKFNVKLFSGSETVEADHFQVEHGGVLTFHRKVPDTNWYEVFLAFSHRDWVRVEGVGD